MSFSQVIYIYAIIIVEFIVEFSVFLVMFLHKLAKRNRFALRVSLLCVAYFAIGLPVAWFYTAFGNTVWGRILVYLVLFAVATVFVWRCFDVNYVTVLFCCSMAYAAQNLVYKVYLTVWTLGESLGLYDGWGEMFDLFYRLMYYIFFGACYTAVWFLFIRDTSEKLSTHEIDVKMLVVTVMVLAITVLLCSVEDIYFAKLSVWRENKFDNPVYYVLRQTGNGFSVVCCIIALLLASKTVVENRLMREVEYLKRAVHQSEKQYEISKDMIDIINVKCHDIRYRLSSLVSEDGAPTEAWEDLNRSIAIYDTRIDTGNKLLDVLLTEKSLYCESNNITLSCMADGAKLDFMEDGDLYCLFGNLLDNALEAVMETDREERRVIDLVVKAKDGMVLIREDNYFNGVLEFSDGLPVTTKRDKNYHGFGMQSLRMIVKKYNGVLTASAEGDIFHLNIMFPLRTPSAAK